MDTGEAMRVADELDAYAHWFAAPGLSSDAYFLTLTLFTEFRDAGRLARDTATVFLRGAVADPAVDDVRLVVSELVGNVVNHVVPDRPPTRPAGSRRIDVTFKRYPQRLFVGVTDEDSALALLPLGESFSAEPVEDLAEAVLPDTGRGLLIVQRLAAAVWWTAEEAGGKTVWCRFDLDGHRAGSPV
jgi:anti-sigma regulatory factor (Ser/Thr protein kinase)